MYTVAKYTAWFFIAVFLAFLMASCVMWMFDMPLNLAVGRGTFVSALWMVASLFFFGLVEKPR